VPLQGQTAGVDIIAVEGGRATKDINVSMVSSSSFRLGLERHSLGLGVPGPTDAGRQHRPVS
jgi:hypothetical protein